MTEIDSFILDRDIRSWYETIGENYQDYYNPLFDIKIMFELVEDDFLISVFKANEIAVSVFTFSDYSKRTDNEILDHTLRRVWELINEPM